MRYSLQLVPGSLVILFVLCMSHLRQIDAGPTSSSFALLLLELSSSEPSVRAAAAERLSRSACPTDKATITALGRLLSAKDPKVSRAVEKALLRLGKCAVLPLADLLLENTSSTQLREEILGFFV